MNFVSKILNMLPDFDFKDEEGNTILHQAVLENNIEMVVLLLEKMQDSSKNIIDIQNNQGNTPFHLAVNNNYNQIAQILDKAGADKTIMNDNGEFVEDATKEGNGNTVLHLAVKKNNINEVMSILKKVKNYGIIDLQNNDGDTAFHLAVKNNNHKIAQVLERAGADKTIKNNKGEYVDDITEDEHLEIVDFKFKPSKNENIQNDLVDILNILGQINSMPTIIVEEKSDIINKDEILNNLLEQYAQQKGGSKKKKSYKVKGIRFIN
jgi:ankyrin repeat protein